MNINLFFFITNSVGCDDCDYCCFGLRYYSGQEIAAASFAHWYLTDREAEKPAGSPVAAAACKPALELRSLFLLEELD
jgi:hypothetical protein